MTISHYMAMADLEVMPKRESPWMGMTDPRVAELRCFKFYSKDSGGWITAPDGRDRWLGVKTLRIFAILDRMAGSGQRITMTSIAKEARCCASTVSRAVTRLQAFNFFAVDVTRGRNGGITVRRRQIADKLKHYAAAAWARIRSWINVASTHKEVDEDLLPTMDATFSREARVEFAGARILDGSWSIDYARAVVGPARERPTEADLVNERATAWALEVIAERERLDREEPDWDFADLR